MSVERQIVDELTSIEESVRRAEQSIVGKDYADRMRIISKLIELEGMVKDIKSNIIIPKLEINLDTEIVDLMENKYLSVRACNVLRRSGCSTLRDVSERTSKEIEVMRNMGAKAHKEVLDFLKKYDISLKEC